MNKWKINIINFNEKSIHKLIKYLNGKSFYAKQLLAWIYKQNINNFIKITDINKQFKYKLIKLCNININKIYKEIINSDNTIKWLIKLFDKNIIETVAIPNRKNHYTLCISTQIGCPLNCKFCYTGKQKFYRNLNTNEIVDQVITAYKRINNLFSNKIITNIVVMGMGEPLLNITNLINAINIISNKNTFNIHKNKITVSSSGIIPHIKTLKKHKIPLAISLHSTNNNDRSKLMPINKKYPIEKLITSCKDYTKNNKLTIEYIMIKNINDTTKHAKNLSILLKHIKCKICLIPFNKFPKTIYNTSNIQNIKTFQHILKKNGFTTTIRKKFGEKINAACGQLKGKVNNI